MKKPILLFLTFLCISGNALAQENESFAVHKKSDFSMEVLFNPFSSSFNSFQLNSGMMQAAIFLSSKDAIRLGLGADFNRDMTSNGEKGDIEKKNNSNISNLKIAIGYERFKSINNRMEVYFGPELSFEKALASANTILGNTTNESWSGATDNRQSNRAFAGINAAFFGGVNFYIYHNLYLGAEFGVKASYNIYAKIVHTEQYGNNSLTDEIISYPSNFSAKIYYLPALRIGWSF